MNEWIELETCKKDVRMREPKWKKQNCTFVVIRFSRKRLHHQNGMRCVAAALWLNDQYRICEIK